MKLHKISDSKKGRAEWVVHTKRRDGKLSSTTVHGTREDVEKRFPELKKKDGE
jgi:hypothetical protein